MRRLRLAWKMAMYALRYERVIFMVFYHAGGEDWLSGYHGRGLSEGVVRNALHEASKMIGETRRVG